MAHSRRTCCKLQHLQHYDCMQVNNNNNKLQEAHTPSWPRYLGHLDTL